MSSERTLTPRQLTFSQSQGYEELPSPLKLEELSIEARTKLWSLLYNHVKAAPRLPGSTRFDEPWIAILGAVHEDVLHQPADEFRPTYASLVEAYKRTFGTAPFNRIFDLLQEIMRHTDCPTQFIQSVEKIFRHYLLAYVVDIGSPATIYPTATEEEGNSILRATDELTGAGFGVAVTHLRQASACVAQRNWSAAVRESIHAVESTARQIDPSARTLEPALRELEKAGALHPALKKAFSSLYGYTSDEQGIRHALIDKTQPNVGQDEAVFMLGACASFSSYLARKHQCPESRLPLGRS